MAPLVVFLLGRPVYRGTKLLVSPEPEDVQARQQIKEDSGWSGGRAETFSSLIQVRSRRRESR